MENPQTVDQRMREVELFLAAHEEQLARQGAIVTTYRQRGGRQLGPYYQLTCRSTDRRQVSVYLGIDQRLVAHVRQRLESLQAARKSRQTWTKIRRTLRIETRAARRQFAAELRPLGLRLQGSEVRGWSSLQRE